MAEERRHGDALAGGAPDHAHQLVEEQDQAEGRQHLVEMVAGIEAAHHHGFDDHAQREGGGQRQQRAQHEGIGPGDQGPGDIGAHHVERAVRQVHEIHDAEGERQSGGEQEHQQAELQAVQHLDQQVVHVPVTSLAAESPNETGARCRAPVDRRADEITSSSICRSRNPSPPSRRWRWSSRSSRRLGPSPSPGCRSSGSGTGWC